MAGMESIPKYPHVLTSRPDEGSTPSETSGNQDAGADKLPQTGMYHLEVGRCPEGP